MVRVTAGIRLRAPSPFGAPSRHSPGCYLWLSLGLRLPGSCSSLRHRKPLLLASSSRPGRCAGEAGSEAARVQGYEPRTQAPHPTPLQGSSREAPPPNANHPAERDAGFYPIVGFLSSFMPSAPADRLSACPRLIRSSPGGADFAPAQASSLTASMVFTTSR